MIGIVGGGISGLLVKHELAKRGIESVLFEKAPVPGGVMQTKKIENRILECGPQRMRLTPTVAEIVEELDLYDQLLEANPGPLYVYHNGRLRQVPLSFRGFLSTDLLSWRGKLRLLGEPVIGASPHTGESVDSYFTRTFGPEFAKRIGGPLYAGLYASDPAAMPVEYSLQRTLDRLGVGRSVLGTIARSALRRRDPPPIVSFEPGMQTLPKAIEETYADSIRLGTPVEDIAESDDGYTLSIPGETVEVDELVLSAPAPASAELLGEISPDTATALSELTYNPLAIVHIHAETALAGSGHQCATTESLDTRGVTWNDSLFPTASREHVYTCFLGGGTNPHVIDWSEAQIAEVAAAEFETVTGFSAEPINVHRWPRAIPAYDGSWTALETLTLPDAIHLCANYYERPGIPGRVVAARNVGEQIA